MAATQTTTARLTADDVSDLVRPLLAPWSRDYASDRYTPPSVSESCGAFLWRGKVRLDGVWMGYEVWDHNPEVDVFDL